MGSLGGLRAALRDIVRRHETLVAFTAAVLICAAVRLPLFSVDSPDDIFFMEGARLWLGGHLPYVASFDVKPPGIFAVFLLPVLGLGDSLFTLRLVMTLADALTACALYKLGGRMGARWIGIWAGSLYPLFSVLVFNNSAYAIFAPAVGGGVLAAVVSQDGSQGRRKLGLIAASGLLLGLACTIKQTCAFETACVMIFLAARARGASSAHWRGVLGTGAWFCAFAALPSVGFCLYFASQHALGPLLADAVKLALARSGGGPEDVSPLANANRFVGLQRYLLVPLILSVVTLLRWKQVRTRVPGALLGLTTAWLATAMLSVLLQRTLYTAYLVAEALPLLLLSGVGLMIGLDELKSIKPAQRVLGTAAITIGLACAYARPDQTYPEDMPALNRAAAMILAQRPSAADRVFVVSGGMWIYALTGRDPPTAYYYPMHTLCDFPGAGQPALAKALNMKPRFIVVADRSQHFICERDDRWAEVRQTLRTDYRKLAHVAGERDSFDLYEIAASGRGAS